MIILGSGTATPSARRGSSGYLLASEMSTLLLDSGSGTMQAIAQAGYDFRDVDAIIYSHLHVDHTSDIAPFLFASRLPEAPRRKELVIIGPPGIRRLIGGLRKLYEPWLEPQTYNLRIREIYEGSISLIDWKITGLPVEHTENALAFRLQHRSGGAIAYSGDSDYCENLVRVARDADVAIIECSYPDGMKVEGHLTPSLAGKLAREANCRKLVLTHFYPPCNGVDIIARAKAEYPGEIVQAEDFMTIEIEG